jgi:ribosome biogenesis GTPase
VIRRAASAHALRRTNEVPLTMIELDVERLRSMGLAAPHAAALMQLPAASAAEPCAAMRVVAVHRDSLRLHDGVQEIAARAMPWLLRVLAEADDGLAVGDWVLVQRDAHGDRWVDARAAPRSSIARRDGDGRRHVVVSNVDTALVVMGLDDDFNPRRLERHLAIVQGSGVQPVVVLTKADTVSLERIDACLAALRTRVPPAVPRVAVDGTQPGAVHALAPWLLMGQTLVAIGSSGAGKSTLTNTLLGAAVQDTGAVRESDGRGQHTTTARTLHRLPGGACVIDTPGLRALRPDGDASTLAAAFDDVAQLSLRCRFRDCRHGDEPGCAVRDGVEPDRLRNFHKLERELRRDTMSALERQRMVSEWKARGRAARTNMRAKRGDA